MNELKEILRLLKQAGASESWANVAFVISKLQKLVESA